ncbi:cation:dicarboxylase symporter family transporter [Phycicoccus endophyticus]|uniref:Cation:dicarboxylase symporter family transporter n=1 Tax=Phycicoccus endophyticus TaxID=1690220 RepID=A0A7G9R0J9_9MICO|nr:cation:dicarboxylase symporter family transporter [Phycicoccus endophyticus]NHI19403.1 cation:dicarboxylase symporter family transporter [Phycicoccus endophyticus]QNN49124.1 cation:dicarboxylase symporter family transporter [Phycicoccus endophyticus]GGL38799.1 C4-dicarboxylate transporter DctA [Phycicoccus endophyticus]
MTTPTPTAPGGETSGSPRRDRTHILYVAVIVAMLLGIVVGFVAPDVGTQLKPLGTFFVNLIKMMISPIIFVTIVLGIGSARRAAQVGRVGGLALGYFLVMSTVALAIGLAVGNVVQPGAGLHLTDELAQSGRSQVSAEAESTTDFLLGLVPETLVSSVTSGSVLQALLVALLVGFALQQIGPAGEPILRGIKHLERLVFRLMAMIMWVAPVGAFGAMAAVVGATGLDALKSLGLIMVAFYATCLIFVFLVLGTVLRVVAGVNVWTLLRYLAREFLLILSTSSSESALPRLIAKMEHLGVSRPVVGITVPTGYSFNLDGTAIYLTMASLFIAEALDKPFSIGQQIGLLVFMVIASKGAAGVTGAGLATLAGGLQSHRPDLLDGVGFIVGIDRMMSEARALTNFAGNSIATVLIGTWVGAVDRDQMTEVLAGRRPFDETRLIDEEAAAEPDAQGEPALAGR